MGAIVCSTAVLASVSIAKPAKRFPPPGAVLTRVGHADADATAVIVLPDGRIVAAGYIVSSPGNASFALARYMPDGRLDGSFGHRGRVVTKFPDSAIATSVLTQSDGKLVVGGYTGPDGPTYNGFNGSFALARYLEDGRLDPSFGTGGTVVTSLEGNDSISEIAMQPDGSILAAGTSDLGYPDSAHPSSRFALIRYLPNGSLDPGFGSGGKVITDFGGFNVGSDLLLMPDGRIEVVGTHQRDDTFPEDLALARFLPNGAPDPSLAGTGTKTSPKGEAVSALAFQPDGHVLTAGQGGFRSRHRFNIGIRVRRFTVDGLRDRSFGDGGHVNLGFKLIGAPYSIATQADGRVLLGGVRALRDEMFQIARLKPSGAVDRHFGRRGTVVSDLSPGDQSLETVATQSDGRILAGGFGAKSGRARFALARYRKQGHLDRSFGR